MDLHIYNAFSNMSTTIVYACLLTQAMSMASSQKPKIFRFQANNKYTFSVEEWAEYNGEILPFSSFTACHWEKLRVFNARDTCPWSLCYKNKNRDRDFQCIQFWYIREPNSGGRYVVASAGFGGSAYGGI